MRITMALPRRQQLGYESRIGKILSWLRSPRRILQVRLVVVGRASLTRSRRSSCADISISPEDESNALLPTSTITDNEFNHFPLNPSVVLPADDELVPVAATTTPAAETHLLFAYDSMEKTLQTTKKILHCYPTNEVLKPLVGIEKWCSQLCVTECPPSLCVCVKI